MEQEENPTTQEMGAPIEDALSVVKHPGGRPPKYKTPEELQVKIDEYFESCWVDKVTETTDKEGTCTMSTVHYQQRPYTMAGLAYHLEMTTQALRDYKAKDEFLCIITRAKQKVEMCWEEQLFDGKGAGSIFWLKNHAGYRDKQEVEHSGELKVSRIERVIVDP